jgi:V/A-type H+-transporting ATPase subunit D
LARLNVNPTRIELKRLKARLKTAVRGHKLLKDKSDEMIRRFSVIIRKNKQLREEVEASLGDMLKQFSVARSLTGAEVVEQAFSMPTSPLAIECGIGNIMGVEVPEISVKQGKREVKFPYSFAGLTSEADASVDMLVQLMPRLVELAETEKTIRMLAEEIERNKRRVNALEYVMIPQLEETIKYISIKLDENERSALTRLMKVKDMLSKEQQ